MCIIIAAPRGKYVPEDYLVESAKANPDGAGIAWVKNRKIHTFKSMNSDLVIQKYKEINYKQTPVLLHFRIATHGTIKKSNIHPFFVKDNIVMAHNGVIYNVHVPKEGDITDSEVFAKMLSSVNFWNNETIQELISEYIGHSKLVFLKNNKDMMIINEHKGHWKDDIWYSNSSYIKPEPLKKSKYWNRSTNSSGNWNSGYYCKQCGVKLLTSEINDGYCWDCSYYGIGVQEKTAQEKTAGDELRALTINDANSHCFECGKILMSEEQMTHGFCDDHGIFLDSEVF